MDKYNGWTNRETWLVGLWFGDYFAETVEETGRGFTADEAKECVEAFTFDCHDLPSSGFIADIIGGSLARINWQEIAEHTEPIK